MTQTRPLPFLASIAYAIRAGWAHYRFARTHYDSDPQINGIGLVVTVRAPTKDEMTDVGVRWCDWNRMQGVQPVDPFVIWSDMKIMWAAYHRKGESVPTPTGREP